MKILVIHALDSVARDTTVRHVHSFGLHPHGHEVFYANIFGPGIVGIDFKIDLTIVNYDVLSFRGSALWRPVTNRLVQVAEKSTRIVAVSQDEFTNSELLDDLFVDLGFDHIFTPISKDLVNVFPKSINAGIEITQVLTGYARDVSLGELEEINSTFDSRPIDLAQRVRSLPLQFGLEAQRKAEIAIDFSISAAKRGFIVDVSSNPNDVLTGEKWTEFLRQTRFTISRRGGASIVDPRNKLAKSLGFINRVAPSFPQQHLEKVVRTSRVKVGDYSSISPRLFEAAENGVCQILEQGTYLEDFSPWIHYIPLKPDYSNVNEVLDAMRDTEYCLELVRKSQEALIISGRFSYKAFVRIVLESLGIGINEMIPPSATDLDFPFGQNLQQTALTKAFQDFWRDFPFPILWRKHLSTLDAEGLAKKFHDLSGISLNRDEIEYLDSWRIGILYSNDSHMLITRNWQPAFNFSS